MRLREQLPKSQTECKLDGFIDCSLICGNVLIIHRFRWATCQLDALENCLDYRSLQKALTSLPRTLDETYKRIIQDIPSESKQNTIRILQFLAFSERPLTIQEAIDAIAVDIEGHPHFSPKYRMPDPADISRCCSSLVVIVPENDEGHFENVRNSTLQLAHFSVKEYLVSDRLPEETAPYFRKITANASISKVCLAYLLQLNGDRSATEITNIFPLAEFSAKYWMAHAVAAEDKDETLWNFIKRFMSCENNSYKTCCSLYRPDEQWQNGTDVQGNEPSSPLYYSSFVGLARTVEWLLSQGCDADVQGGVLGNALQAASAAGHEQIVMQLLRKQSNINSPIGDYGNALHLASLIGRIKIVVLLLDSGADVNIQGGDFGSALQAAAFGGHEYIVKLLLDKGANVDIKNGQYGSALQAASLVGHCSVVELLLDKGADVNMCVGHYGTALQAASVARHEHIVRLLIDRGANINIRGGYFGHVLHAASFGGHESIVKLLLDSGADVNIQGGYYGNALQAASSRGHKQIVKLLLDSGANIDIQGGRFGNALKAASAGKHETIKGLLLDRKGAGMSML